MRRHRALLIWLGVLLLAIGTHKIGWDFLSIPLTLGWIGGPFVITQVEFVSSMRDRRRDR